YYADYTRVPYRINDQGKRVYEDSQDEVLHLFIGQFISYDGRVKPCMRYRPLFAAPHGNEM
ncbi:hypothetical protein FOZ63_024827, partial [Perkinsus olseni]